MNYSYTTRNITYMQQKTYDNSIKFGKRVKELRLKSCKSLNNFVIQEAAYQLQPGAESKTV